MVFEIDNIELNFGKKNILNAVYLKAETGKITGILGRNGSGKSCLLRIIFGALKPKTKLFRIDQKPFLKKPFLTGNVRFLPQHRFIPKGFSIKGTFENFGVDWSEFCACFETFSKYENHTIGELSNGEIRLLQAYLVIKSKAELILLDEPFSHIAPVYIEQLKEILTEEKHHKAIILTDHLYREITEIADELYLLKEGASRLIESEESLRFQGYLG